MFPETTTSQFVALPQYIGGQYMNLPSDFDQTLKTIEAYGILKEDARGIRNRLILAIEGAGAMQDAGTIDLGVMDWAGTLLHDLKVAIHKEICDSEKGQLKDTYLNLLDKTLTKDGITVVASALTKIVAEIHPGFAVSSVIIFLAIWLIKVGLNHWCSRPVVH